MAETTIAKLDFKITCDEQEASLGAAAKSSGLLHEIKQSATYTSGTTSSKQDLVFSATFSLASTTQAYDVAGSLASALNGTTMTAVEITAIIVKNTSTTTGYYLKVGAGSNPLLNWVDATGDAIRVGPGGLFVNTSPVDGFAVTATTGDVLTIDSGSNTVTGEIMLLGRTA